MNRRIPYEVEVEDDRVFTLTFDGDGPIPSSWDELVEANADDPEPLEAMDALLVGEEHHAGGGAAPLVTTRRVR